MSATSRGKLRGTLIISGAKASPGKCGCLREPGVVVVTSSEGKRHRIKVGRSGRFSALLAPGRYHAIGGVPQLGWKLGECVVDSPRAPAWIRVAAHTTTKITVDCHGH